MKDTSSDFKRPPMSAEELLPHLFAYQQEGIPFPLTVTGLSMVPFLHHLQDRVLLVSPEQRKPRRGEILLCRRPDGSLVLHRCLKKYKDGSFLLNGDNQQWRERQSAGTLLAVVDRFYRRGKPVDCDRLGYRLLASVWMCCRPIRPLLFRAVALFRRPRGQTVR